MENRNKYCVGDRVRASIFEWADPKSGTVVAVRDDGAYVVSFGTPVGSIEMALRDDEIIGREDEDEAQ